MSNVRIEAIGEDDLSVEIMLGDANRGWYDIKAGESADLAVGGNQTLSVDLASAPQVVVKRGDSSTFITPDDEPAVETPWVTKEEDVPIGVDVQAEDEGREVQSDAGEVKAGGVNTEDEGREAQSIGAGDVGDIGLLFGAAGDEAVAAEAKVEGGSEVEAEASVISNLEADSPLEVGSLSDLPSPFDVDSGESTEGVIEEAEDTGEEAQA